MPHKYYIKTFGCQMNEYDSSKMADVLNAAHGMVAAATPEDATVALGTRTIALKFVLTKLDAFVGKRMSVSGMLIGRASCRERVYGTV